MSKTATIELQDEETFIIGTLEFWSGITQTFRALASICEEQGEDESKETWLVIAREVDKEAKENMDRIHSL